MPIEPSMIPIGTEIPLVNAFFATVMGVGATYLVARNKFSKLDVELRKDRAEKGQISRLEEEISRLTKERNEVAEIAKQERLKRVEDASTIAKLKAENEFMQRELIGIAHRTGKMARGLSPEMRKLFDTAFTDLDEGSDNRRTPDPGTTRPLTLKDLK